VNGQPKTRQSNSTNASSISLDSIGTSSTTSPAAPSHAVAESSSDKKKKTSPAVAMAEVELYQVKLAQLREEYMKASAF